MNLIRFQCVFVFLLASIVLWSQENILDMRENYNIGETVTVSGVITSDDNLGSVRYLQDATAGIAIYPGADWSSWEATPQIGDSLSVTGGITEYNGLLEVGPDLTAVEFLGTGILPEPLEITPAQMGENLEGQLVRVNAVTFPLSGTVIAGNSSYDFSSSGETGVLYVRTSNTLVGEQLSDCEVDLLGIVSQFTFDGTGGYQLLPRGPVDLIPVSAFCPTANPCGIEGVVVEASNFAYAPSALEIEVGQTVVWVNVGGTHDVNGDVSSITGESFNNPETFDIGPVVGNSDGVCLGSHTFTLEGIYGYDCSVGAHAANGMVATVTVNPAEVSNSVFDIIVASNNHTTLESFLLETSLAGALSGEGPFTLFAPTDDAIELQGLGVVEALLNDIPLLTDILLNHVVSDQVLSVDLSNGQVLNTLLGNDVTVGINNGQLFIDNAMVTVADIVADNGVVHVIDAVLIPEDEEYGTVVTIIQASANHTFLALAIEAAGLTNALSGEGPFTLFAPDDMAFDVLLDELGFTAEEFLASPDLIDILLNHVVSDQVLSGDLFSGQTITTLIDDEVEVTIVGGNVFINNAMVTVADIVADNGVLHVIDKVLSPSLGDSLPCEGASDIFISEYFEGTGNNKGVEFYNPTAHWIDLSTYVLERWPNGGMADSYVQLAGFIGPHQTHVLVNGQTEDVDLGGGSYSPAVDPDLLALADQLDASEYPAPTYFNGDDALVLIGSDGIVDIFGNPLEDPGSGWTDDSLNGFVDNGGGVVLTANHTLRRKPFVLAGVTEDPVVFDALSEWDVFEVDDWSGLGWHLVSCEEELTGCTETSACNFEPDAVVEDNELCVFPGCQDSNALNFDSEAGCAGECIYLTYDCLSIGDEAWSDESVGLYPAMQQAMHGVPWSGEWVFNVPATVLEPQSGVSYGVHHVAWSEVDGLPDWVDSSEFTLGDLGASSQHCIAASGIPSAPGTHEITASGEVFISIFGQEFSIGEQTYSAWLEVTENPNPIPGCMYGNAVNYVTFANVDNGSCLFAGCTDENAGNFNPLATIDDGSCGEACDPENESMCTTDVNNDGFVNVSDLLLLLSEFGETCL